MTYRLCLSTKESRPVNPLPRSDPDAASVFGFGFTNRIDRSAPRALVEVEGRDVRKIGFEPLVSEVEVHEEIGKVPSARVVITDPEGKFMDDPLWLEGRKIRIGLGYPTTQIVTRGQFVVSTPTFEFGDRRRIQLNCYGEEIKLHTTEERKPWRNRTDSNVATEIAKKHGFKPNVQDTKIKYEQITQANETDGQFLAARARLYGYEFYVEDGELHFHEPRAESSGIVVQYRGGDRSTIGRFRAGVSPSFKALTASATGVDPLTGEVFVVNGDKAKVDEVTNEGLRAAIGRTRDAQQIAEIRGAGEKFVIGGGHLAQEAARQLEIDGLTRMSRWVVEAHGECEGLEALRVRKTLRVLGAGRWGGDYRIVRAIHKFRPGYRVEFDLARTWTGEPGQEVASPVTGGPSASSASGGLSDASSRSVLAGIAVEES